MGLEHVLDLAQQLEQRRSLLEGSLPSLHRHDRVRAAQQVLDALDRTVELEAVDALVDHR